MNNEYKTRDLAEASILLARKQRLLRIDRQGRICWFVFADKESCERLVYTFWFSECLIDGKTFYQAMETLKNKIFSRQ